MGPSPASAADLIAVLARRSSAQLDALPSVLDVRRRARRCPPSFVYDFVEGGAEDEDGLRHNRRAYGHYRLVPQYLSDVRIRDTSCELFGRRWSAPVGISPTGLAGVVRPGADIARAAAAAARNVPFVLSTASSERMEDVAQAADGAMWFQLYLLRDWAIAEDLLRRARCCGVDVLVLTVDVPVSSKRERDLRNGFTVPLNLGVRGIAEVLCHPSWALRMLRSGAPTVVNVTQYLGGPSGVVQRDAFMDEQSNATMTWEALRRLRDLWPGRLVLKGVLSPHDVRRSVEHGMDGVVASNHGGRQLDSAPSPVEVLPALVEAASGRLAVLIDSGIMRGSDVVKAVALGAKFAFIGKASLYGLAAGGQPGVERVLDILIEEMSLCLGQIGCRTPGDLGADQVMRAWPEPGAPYGPGL